MSHKNLKGNTMKFYKINGDAGTGKTNELIKSLRQHNLEDVLVVTPTNKAAMVLNKRFNAEGLDIKAQTLFSTLYSWRQTDIIKNRKRIRSIDSNTLKFEKDIDGRPVYHEEIEYEFERIIKHSVRDKIIFIDEASMVASDIWRDILEADYFPEIWTFGDEKQLPPIEQYENLDPTTKPYYRFWHNFNEDSNVITLQKNHRQAGDLKDFVADITNTIFKHYNASIPDPLMIGDNFSLHANDIIEDDLKNFMLDADIIITPYQKVRKLSNIIMRRILAEQGGRKYSDLPVRGDRIIFVDSIKRIREAGAYRFKELYLAKNVCATITEIIDYSPEDNTMIINCIDEMNIKHNNIIVSLNIITGLNSSAAPIPRIDYSYAITVHSSQGAQWPRVLFLNGHWPNDDRARLRYVAITRAEQQLAIINGITNSIEAKDAERSILIRLGYQFGAKKEIK